jgi:hypothetical protein
VSARRNANGGTENEERNSLCCRSSRSMPRESRPPSRRPIWAGGAWIHR